MGHSGRGLEDVPHLVASALLPDSPQQDGSSPRYAQLNIHERLSAQSVPAVKRILHRHAYKYSPERTVYAVRGLGDLKGEAAGVLNAFLQPLNHQAWSPSPPHPPSDRVRWTQTKRDRAHCHAPLKHRRVLPSALGPWLEEVDAPRALRRTVRSGR